MKILELRLKNLNSLYGEWCIDFSNPEYVSNGIFALTGPTGAGKSTILDAICLALYGATPRLGRITKSSNELMSRQTGECYAEVVFESQAGRFRCHWEQRRARKKAEGKLQDQEHQIADADTGKPIETKKSLVVKVIEEKTGMDFDRFTRSILLAQGGFDTFLKADVEEKSTILEQITGTEIYSEISRRVHVRRQDERNKLELLQAEITGIAILEPEQEREIQQALEAKLTEERTLADKCTETGKCIAWLAIVDGLKKELLDLSKEAAGLQERTDAFKPEQEKLEQAMQAASMDGEYAALTALRRQQADDQEALKGGEEALPELEFSAITQTEALRMAEQHTLNAKEALQAAAPLIRKIRSLDEKLAAGKKAILEDDEYCARGAAKIDEDKQARLKEQKKRTEAKESLRGVEGCLDKHAQDEWLIGGLAGVEEQFGNLLSKQREIAQKENALRDADIALVQATEKLKVSTKRCNICEQELNDATKKLQQGKDALLEVLGDRLLREYRAEKESLLRERAYIRKIEALEEHRAQLEDGKPCPLCGSTEHPFAEENVPVPDEIEQKISSLDKLISKAEELEAVVKKLEQEETSARNHLNDSEKLQSNVANDKKVAEKTLAELGEELAKLRSHFEELKRAVSEKLQPLGIAKIPDDDVSSLLTSLKARLNAWQEQVRKKMEIEKQIASIDSEIKRLDAIIETQSTALTEKQEALDGLKKEHATDLDKRRNLYEDKKPDEEEIRLNKAIADAENVEKTARSRNVELQQKLTSSRTHVESLRMRIEQRAPELRKEECDFAAALEPVGFADEGRFLEARLTHQEREALSARAKELEHAQTVLRAKQHDREARLSVEIAKEVTDKTLETLEPQLREYEDSLKQLRETIAALKHRLEENATSRERIKEKEATIEAQREESRRWDNLHTLIGSADGKRYRNFAQGLTFDLMVSHANRQLEKMSDRYLLIRDHENPLELNVVDNYQAGEIRSTKNLSGGESFIVSLTLALGLSKMASRKVRVDSLFLDEGFGTLDEEALETALETLSGLQQDGKLIGIISHIAALRERISTQIRVEPASEGKSLLSGPGCCKN